MKDVATFTTAAVNGDGNPIDITVPYAPYIPVWPGDTPYCCGWTARREDGASINLGLLTTSAHAGTHADAPLHVESGWHASEDIPLAPFVGECTVISVANKVAADTTIGLSMIAAAIGEHTTKRLLVHTGYSVCGGLFPNEWPSLSNDALRWLISRGVLLFGTDAPSVDERNSKSLPVHHELFSSGAYVLENLSLNHVAPANYTLVAQPMALHGADAAPVRALLYPIHPSDRVASDHDLNKGA